MKWFEYKMEVDELQAPDDLKARLLAMQPSAPAPAKTAPLIPCVTVFSARYSTSASDSQPANALLPMSVTEDGIVTLFIALSLNASAPI